MFSATFWPAQACVLFSLSRARARLSILLMPVSAATPGCVSTQTALLGRIVQQTSVVTPDQEIQQHDCQGCAGKP